jgi:threonine aldolase
VGSDGRQAAKKTETNLVWADLMHAGVCDEDFAEVGRNFDLKLDGGRLVLHHQISKEAIRRLGLLFEKVLLSR